MSEPKTLTVIKQDHTGTEVWRYQGSIIAHTDEHMIVEAFFDRDDMLFHGMWLRRGDRFVETYYFTRSYNIFEVHACEDDHIRGWYCNIATPAEFDGKRVIYCDLALDLLVFPDGRQLVLDEEEFSNLPLLPEQRQKARMALVELQSIFNQNKKE